MYGIYSRILATVYAIFFTFISLVTIIIMLKPSVFDAVSDYIKYNILMSRSMFIIVIILSLIILTLSIIYLSSGLRSNKDKKAVNKHTSIGVIMISLDAVESIALNTVKRINGVKEAKAHIYKLKDEESVSVVIRVVVLSEVNIPAISQDIQVKVKKSIEDSSGIAVANVKVIVENIHTAYRPRVE